ncbi:hypothetical protein RIN66_08250 [Hafnia alvei]|uniref:hypothetical protein n=1 Tax=Hafnia alvei TaxID=569 RepID=UPI0028BD1A23|nr:hypothetical protein [Hafnia alvei]WNN53989.1 hypothetical protein RIN66_08250 [Hafnia alvei]
MPETQREMMTDKTLANTMAAAKAIAANQKGRKAARKESHQQNEAIERLARKYAYLKRRRDADLPATSDFSNELHTGRVSDALDAVLKRQPEKRYWVPEGSRGF